MAALSNKVNTLVICYMKWNQCADDPAFIFNYLNKFYMVSRPYPLHPFTFIRWVPSDDWILFCPVFEIQIYEVSIKEAFYWKCTPTC